MSNVQGLTYCRIRRFIKIISVSRPSPEHHSVLLGQILGANISKREPKIERGVKKEKKKASELYLHKTRDYRSSYYDKAAVVESNRLEYYAFIPPHVGPNISVTLYVLFARI